VPGGDCRCSDGSEFSFWVREANPEKVVFFFRDGGACFSAETCAPEDARYNTTITKGPGEGGVFDFADERNPFADYSFVFVPYCTGDVFIGNVTREYEPSRLRLPAERSLLRASPDRRPGDPRRAARAPHATRPGARTRSTSPATRRRDRPGEAPPGRTWVIRRPAPREASPGRVRAPCRWPYRQPRRQTAERLLLPLGGSTPPAPRSRSGSGSHLEHDQAIGAESAVLRDRAPCSD
jgi:hypothetical protein